jgi:hypothetical protein
MIAAVEAGQQASDHASVAPGYATHDVFNPAGALADLECHGGNGFIADHRMERLYREAPLNGIWEGTGNVICLDVLRSMQREPETVDAFLAEIRKARGADARLKRNPQRGITAIGTTMQ